MTSSVSLLMQCNSKISVPHPTPSDVTWIPHRLFDCVRRRHAAVTRQPIVLRSTDDTSGTCAGKLPFRYSDGAVEKLTVVAFCGVHHPRSVRSATSLLYWHILGSRLMRCRCTDDRINRGFCGTLNAHPSTADRPKNSASHLVSQVSLHSQHLTPPPPRTT